MGSRAVSQGLIELGERIRERRQEIRLSQEAFAELAGVSVNTVIRVEGGRTAMSVEIFAKMAEALGVNAGELLGGQIFGAAGINRLDKVIFRIRHLKKSDQELVLKTLDALIDGLCRRE